MEGAAETGARAAREVLDSLGLRLRGKPTPDHRGDSLIPKGRLKGVLARPYWPRERPFIYNPSDSEPGLPAPNAHPTPPTVPRRLPLNP